MKRIHESPYEFVSRRLAEEDAPDSVEAVVARRAHDRGLSKRSARLAQRLMNALPTPADRQRWFQWEQLVGEREHLFDRTLFDVAYEIGRADELTSRHHAAAESGAVVRVHAALRAERLDGAGRIRTLLIVALTTLHPLSEE